LIGTAGVYAGDGAASALPAVDTDNIIEDDDGPLFPFGVVA
jgi:hypothetical protein